MTTLARTSNAGFTTNLKLGASTQPLTQMSLHVGRLRVVINIFLIYRIYDASEIRALLSFSLSKNLTYDQLDFAATRQSEMERDISLQ